MIEQTIIPPSGGADAPFSSAPVYGSVFKRFIALMVDKLIVSIMSMIILIPLGLFASFSSFLIAPAAPLVVGIAAPSLYITIIILDCVYFAAQESSDCQATLGKRLMGLRVTGESGGKISFARACGRYFAKILSALPFMIGFLMAFVTKRKQALHDLIAETLVVKA